MIQFYARHLYYLKNLKKIMTSQPITDTLFIVDGQEYIVYQWPTDQEIIYITHSLDGYLWQLPWHLELVEDFGPYASYRRQTSVANTR